jgi:hypothetical protein
MPDAYQNLLANFEVDMPGNGGKFQLQTLEEVDLFEQTRDAYIKDYGLTKQNDLLTLGSILSLTVEKFRAQKQLTGMEPELDANNVPTGRYKVSKEKKERSAALSTITKISAEIREIEKTMGLDKKTRDAGGQHSTANYIDLLKRKAHEYGVRITERTKEFERVMMEARWKIRLLRNGDPEDRAHHNITETEIINWLEKELAKIEANDKKWAKEKGKLFVGKA